MNLVNRHVLQLVVFTGVSTVVAQLLIVREFLTQFQGNEFVIALILFNWLVLGGLGTGISHRLSRRYTPSVTILGSTSLALAVAPAVVLIAIRVLHRLVFIPGASVGFFPTLAFTFLVMAPYGLMVGLVLPYSLFVIRGTAPQFPGARIYIRDNLGDAAGGALFTFVLVWLVTPLQAVAVSAVPMMICAWRVMHRSMRRQWKWRAYGLTMLGVAAMGMLLEPISLKPAVGHLLEYVESRFGRIQVVSQYGQVTVLADGVPVHFTQDPVGAEEAVHYPLSQLAHVRQVMLVSASSGMLEELNRYHPAGIDYVELDPEISRIQFRYELLEPVPGLSVIHRDARAFLADTDKIYDAILVNLPDPTTYQTNRFFTDRFFEMARSRLASGGVLSFSIAGYDNYLAPPRQRMLSSLFNTASRTFSHILLLPGQRIYFICGDRTMDPDIPGRLAAKRIATRYVGGFYTGNVTAERIRQLRDWVDATVPENRDTAPYLMQMMLSDWFSKYASYPTFFAIVLMVGYGIYLACISREEFALFTTGFSVMGTEILVIFAFQMFFGYVYQQIGLIVTVFLAGLLPGAWVGERRANRALWMLRINDGLLVVMVAAFMAAVFWKADAISPVLTLAFGFAVSFLCGCEFPAALALRGGDNRAVVKTFSADLTGAAAGTLATSVVLIPYLGLYGAAFGLIAVKLASLMRLTRSS